LAHILKELLLNRHADLGSKGEDDLWEKRSRC
jgi:hypothetical protein